MSICHLSSASRSFGRIIYLFKHLQNMGIRTYETLYSSYVVPIMNYGAAVWGFSDYTEAQVLQNRIIRYFLGVHKFAPIPALHIEVDWLCTRYQRWVEMIRYRNCIAAMGADRLPRILYEWDCSLGRDAWARQVEFVLQYANMYEVDETQENEDIIQHPVLKHVDLDALQAGLLRLDRERWWTAAADMPKLRTYIELYEDHDDRGLVYTHLTRRQRSLVAKLKMGILPLGLEVGRFKNVPIEYRLCCICDDYLLDDEYHFILYCEGLKDVRSKYFAQTTILEDVDDPTDKVEICKLLLNSRNLRKTARFLEEMYDSRLKLMYK